MPNLLSRSLKAYNYKNLNISIEYKGMDMFDEIINEQLIRLIYKLEGWDYEDSDSDSDYEPSDTDDTDDETDDDTVSEDVSFLGCNVVIM